MIPKTRVILLAAIAFSWYTSADPKPLTIVRAGQPLDSRMFAAPQEDSVYIFDGEQSRKIRPLPQPTPPRPPMPTNRRDDKKIVIRLENPPRNDIQKSEILEILRNVFAKLDETAKPPPSAQKTELEVIMQHMAKIAKAMANNSKTDGSKAEHGGEEGRYMKQDASEEGQEGKKYEDGSKSSLVIMRDGSKPVKAKKDCKGGYSFHIDGNNVKDKMIIDIFRNKN